MSYHALARKYRPSRFGEMVGQAHVTETLCAALRKDKLSHAYLFSGPRGCGKTSVARLLAKALNCSNGAKDDPCGECETCRSIAAGSYLDVLEIDAASHTGVDNIRELRDMAQYTPSRGASRVFIIDEVHMLSKGAFNALLKILEEPPPSVFFFFATTEPNRIPRTILSRCQRFDFHLLTREDLEARLREIIASEGMTITPEALRLVVTLAEGSMRDGLSILDQVLAGCDGEVAEGDVVRMFGLVQSDLFTRLNEAILSHDPASALRLIGEMMHGGRSLDDFARELVNNFRNLLLLKIDPQLGRNISLPEEQLKQMAEQAERFSRQDLLALLDKASRGFERIHRSAQPRVLLEALIVELSLMESRVLLADLARRLEALGAGSPSGGGSGGSGDRPGASVSPARTRGAAPPAAETAPVRESAPARDAFRQAGAATVAGWSEFIAAMTVSHPGMASCLLEGVPSVRDETTIAFAFPAGKQFQWDQLQSCIETVQENARAHLGRKLVLELVAGDDDSRRDHREKLRRKVAPTEQEALQKACAEGKPLRDLVEMLDAEIIPEAEREDWLRKTEQTRQSPKAGDQ